MKYKLTVNDEGKVAVVKKAGTSYIRLTEPEGKCKGLIETADKVEKSEMFDGLGISINGGEMFFAGKIVPERKKKE